MIKKEKVKDFYKLLPIAKIEANLNPYPIKMELFISFLTIKLKRKLNCLGSINGWTKLENIENSLIIQGCKSNGVEYLDSIESKKNPTNKHNDYVNPFSIFELLSKKGKLFFFRYYMSEISQHTSHVEDDIKFLGHKLKEQKKYLQELNTFRDAITDGKGVYL
jgi:hypothetical protein